MSTKEPGKPRQTVQVEYGQAEGSNLSSAEDYAKRAVRGAVPSLSLSLSRARARARALSLSLSLCLCLCLCLCICLYLSTSESPVRQRETLRSLVCHLCRVSTARRA